MEVTVTLSLDTHTLSLLRIMHGTQPAGHVLVQRVDHVRGLRTWINRSSGA